MWLLFQELVFGVYAVHSKTLMIMYLYLYFYLYLLLTLPSHLLLSWGLLLYSFLLWLESVLQYFLQWGVGDTFPESLHTCKHLSHQQINIILVRGRNLGSKLILLAVSQCYYVIFYFGAVDEKFHASLILFNLCKLLFFLYGNFKCFLFIPEIQKQSTFSDFVLVCVFSNINLA